MGRLIARIRAKFFSAEFSRNVITLMFGTILAQIIPIVVSPILTRLYDPSEFGLFSVYAGIVGILAIIVTGRYELAIMLPDDDENAFHLAMVAITTTVSGSLLILFLIGSFNEKIVYWSSVGDIGNWLYFVPLSTLLVGVFSIINNWKNRKKQFKDIATVKVTQAVVTAISNVSLGDLSKGFNGLIVSLILGQGAAAVLLGRTSEKKKNTQFKKKISFVKMKENASRYSDFPKYLIVAHLLNSLSSYMPLIFLLKLYDSSISGYYALAERTSIVPIVLIAKAFGDVFRQRATEDFAKYGNSKQIYLATLKKLFILSIGPFTILFFFSPDLFSFVFGSEWRTSGEFAQIMVLMFFLQFMANPLGNLFMVAEKQKLDLLWQTLLCLFSFSSIYISYLAFDNPKTTILVYSLVISFMYIVNILMSYKFSLGNDKKRTQ